MSTWLTLLSAVLLLSTSCSPEATTEAANQDSAPAIDRSFEDRDGLANDPASRSQTPDHQPDERESGEFHDQEGHELVKRVLADTPPTDPGPDVGGISMQMEMFEDGRVTAAEYERAVRETVDCIRSEGFSVIGPARYPDEQAGMIVSFGVDPSLYLNWAYENVEMDDALTEVEDSCRAQWSWWVEQVWELQNEPSQQEIETWLQNARECAADLGLTVSSPPDFNEVLEAVLAGCRPWEATSS